uniref:Leucine-rich repeat-containing N-terminal plant-type domain-containing protein n=1 Tax=Lactuca sativa TaxID=4236 RepID=A0A9R1XYI1_LACSA|nr:hypothetical protein LSAT_V11C100013730 [Lactuca sativa]
MVVWKIQGDCIEEERKELPEIKASHIKSYDFEIDDFLPTWVDYGSSSPEDGGRNCCDWERVSCNTTTGHNSLDKEFMKTGLEKFSSLKKLEVLDLSMNYDIDNDILPSLRTLTSLKILDHQSKTFHDLPHLKVLLLKGCNFSGTLPMEGFASFHHLEVLDLSYNSFVGSIPLAIHAISSLRALSFANNELNDSLPDQWLCELKNLHELDLRNNMFDGILLQCFNNLSSLELLDISLNRFTRILPPSLIANLTSLKYIDFSHNKFEGPFLFSSFSNHTKLIVVGLRSDNDKFEVETEEPIDWIPEFQLEVLELSNCNINGHKGHVVPGFLVHKHKLRVVNMNDNSLKGHFPNWLIKNSTNLEVLLLRNNSFGGMPLYRSVNLLELDISGNHMTGAIPDKTPKFFPNISCLDFSRNALSGAIPSSIGDLSELSVLDLSDNKLSGEVPNGLFTNVSHLRILRLSMNKLHGQVLSGNLSMRDIERVHLDNNYFTGEIGTKSMEKLERLSVLDISNNFFTGMIPDWISSMSYLSELVVRNNSFEGQFPYGSTPSSFLDISQNSFFGPIPSCLNLQKNEASSFGWLDSVEDCMFTCYYFLCDSVRKPYMIFCK